MKDSLSPPQTPEPKDSAPATTANPSASPKDTAAIEPGKTAAEFLKPAARKKSGGPRATSISPEQAKQIYDEMGTPTAAEFSAKLASMGHNISSAQVRRWKREGWKYNGDHDYKGAVTEGIIKGTNALSGLGMPPATYKAFRAKYDAMAHSDLLKRTSKEGLVTANLYMEILQRYGKELIVRDAKGVGIVIEAICRLMNGGYENAEHAMNLAERSLKTDATILAEREATPSIAPPPTAAVEQDPNFDPTDPLRERLEALGLKRLPEGHGVSAHIEGSPQTTKRGTIQ